MFKKLLLVLLPVVLLAACNGGINHSSVEEASETMVQALIDADETVIDELNKDATYPTEYIMSDIVPDFQGTSLENFDFILDEENEMVVEYDEIRYRMELVEQDGNYYISKIR